MLLKKEGFPDEDSYVLCTVSNIHFHSVFIKLDEYGKTGLIHISEISPGRIRNIRDYVVEGKKIVCKVLRVDKKTGHIDLSLRRVNENQKRTKINEIKQEQKAEKIVEQVAKENNLDFKKLYTDITSQIVNEYDDLKTYFKEIVQDSELIRLSKVDKKISDQLVEIINVRFKDEDVVISGILKLSSYEPDGVNIIKKCLKEALTVKGDVKISYVGGGAYKIMVTSKNYKDAEKTLKNVIEKAQVFVKKGLGTSEFIRKEKE